MTFTLNIAGIPIGIKHKYSYVSDISREYMTEEEPLFWISVTDGDIENEKSMAEGNFPAGVLESTAIYRAISEKIADYGAFIFHGAVIEYEGKAYLFTAKSGVGKTTHIRLWQKLYKEKVSVLNGDKPVIRVMGDKILASGTPWRGKEGYGKPGISELSGIAFLERGKVNEAFPIDIDRALIKFATQAYIPREYAAAKVLSLFGRVLEKIPLFTLRCNMEDEAARVALSAFLTSENN